MPFAMKITRNVFAWSYSYIVYVILRAGGKYQSMTDPSICLTMTATILLMNGTVDNLVELVNT